VCVAARDYFRAPMRPTAPFVHVPLRSVWLVLALLVGLHMAQAQGDHVCTPLLYGSAMPPDLVPALEAHYKAHNAAVDVAPAKVRKAVLEDWTHLQTDLIESLNDEHFIFGTPLNDLLDSITALLVPHLPGPSATPRVLLSWYPWPNASCRGEGTIVVNIGMLERLNSRAELAFILGHELAHHYFDHVGHGIEQVHTRMNSDEFQAEVNAVLRQEFDRVAQLEALFISFSINERRHGRNHELVSDSLALRLMQAAGFDALAAPSVMDVLAACDREAYTTAVNMESAFRSSGADAEGDWMAEEQVSSLGNVDTRDTVLAEELRTHPDCEIRKLALFDLLELDYKTRVVQDDATYLALKPQIASAVLESALISRDLGRAVFVGQHLVNREPSLPEAHAGLALAYAGMERGLRLHQLSRVLDQPARHHSQHYQRTLQMLNRMRVRDHAAMAVYNLRLAQEKAPACELTYYAALKVAANGPSSVDLEEARKAYLDTFPDGHYREEATNMKLIASGSR